MTDERDWSVKPAALLAVATKVTLLQAVENCTRTEPGLPT